MATKPNDILPAATFLLFLVVAVSKMCVSFGYFSYRALFRGATLSGARVTFYFLSLSFVLFCSIL
jgi:hypothetical protein